MAERPNSKKDLSDMAEDPVFEVVKESQCAACVHNEGLKCSAFGQKPMKYMDAFSDKECPERKTE